MTTLRSVEIAWAAADAERHGLRVLQRTIAHPGAPANAMMPIGTFSAPARIGAASTDRPIVGPRAPNTLLKEVFAEAHAPRT